MTQLPEKLEQATDTSSGSSVFQIRDVVNQLITYLEERALNEKPILFSQPPSGWEQPTYADGYKQGKFDAEMDASQKTLTLKKPEWWPYATEDRQSGYERALNDVSDAWGITINLE